MIRDQPSVTPSQSKEFTAMVHVGLREKPFVVDCDGARYDLPAEAVRLSGQRVSVVADPGTFTATIK